MSKSELSYLVYSEKSKIDWNIKVTLSQIHSAYKIARGYSVTIFDIIYAVQDNNGKLVDVNIHKLLKGLNVACKEGYVKFEKRRYSLTAKGIDVVGETRSDLSHRHDLMIKGIKYRIG